MLAPVGPHDSGAMRQMPVRMGPHKVGAMHQMLAPVGPHVSGAMRQMPVRQDLYQCGVMHQNASSSECSITTALCVKCRPYLVWQTHGALRRTPILSAN